MNLLYFIFGKRFRCFFCSTFIEQFRMKKTSKTPPNFCCEDCDFKCSKRGDYVRHLTTAKHTNRTILNENTSKNINFVCECGKEYKARNSLWYHKQKCNITSINNVESSADDFIIDKEFVMTILKQNNDLQTQVLELLKNGTHNTNSHNKTFNLQFFLNETCKNAMNITDFVNSLQLQLGDLEKMGDIGYINGMSNIIVKNLKDMDITERPVHCTDVKREVLYVKDEDKWCKETDSKPKIRNAIKTVAHKNMKLITEYKEKYPNYKNSSSTDSDKYNKVIIEAMGGKGDNELDKENKIIRNLTKEIILEKEVG